jgi:hypothetical protein
MTSRGETGRRSRSGVPGPSGDDLEKLVDGVGEDPTDERLARLAAWPFEEARRADCADDHLALATSYFETLDAALREGRIDGEVYDEVLRCLARRAAGPHP